MNVGTIYALVALTAWAFDDFFIGRATKKLGDIGSLFWLALFGTATLLPFSYSALAKAHTWSMASTTTWILLAMIGVTLIAALADFEALRVGKLSTIDPLYALEIPITLLIAYITIREELSAVQLALTAAIVVSMVLVSVKSLHGLRALRWEKGVQLALLSVLFMGATNFLTAHGARITSPIMANWIVYAGLLAFTSTCLIIRKKFRYTIGKIAQNKSLLIAFGIADVVAWTSFAKSATHIPIGLTTTISEAYIAIAVLLGLYINKEKLRGHQLVGVGVIITAVLTLCYISS